MNQRAGEVAVNTTLTRSRIRSPLRPGDTGCTAVTDFAEWSLLGPMTCGYLASRPHPDPEKGYREPLCEVHYEEAAHA